MSEPQQAAVANHQILLCLRNEALAAAGATATATSEAPSTGNPLTAMTADKLTSGALDNAWRSGSITALLSGGVSEISVTIALAYPRPVDWVSLHRTNVLIPWRYRLRRRQGEDPVFESPWLDPLVKARPSDFETFSEMAWTLGLSQRTQDALASRFFLDNIGPADRVYTGVREVELVFDVSSGANGRADYVQVGMPYVCQTFRPTVNMPLGWGLTPMGRSEVKRAESGAKVGRARTPGKTLTFGLNWAERSETWGRVWDDIRDLGELGLVFAWPEPQQRRYFYAQALLGTFTDALPAAKMLTLTNPGMEGWSIEEAP